MKSQFTKEPDGTITLKIPISLDIIEKAREEEIKIAVEHSEIRGFRKGKAPRKIVEEHIDKAKLKEDVLKKLLPQSYLNAISEHNLKPVISPKIHVEKLDENKDWVFTAITCEAPIVTLDGYKDEIKKVTAKSKIIIPGKEKQEVKLDEVIKALLDHAKITIPQILVDQEVERLLSQLLDEIKKLGLSLDQYLASTQKTPDDLKKEYREKAERDISFEFVLQKIAEDEHIMVEQKEVDEAIQKAKDEKERQNLESHRYLLTSILRQQKTLDFLKNL